MTTAFGTDAARRTARIIRDRIGAADVDTAIILGSGLGRLTDRLAERVVVPYGDLPGFPSPTVAGHSGAVVAGDLGGKRVIALSGRFHMYEGHEAVLAGFRFASSMNLAHDSWL